MSVHRGVPGLGGAWSGGLPGLVGGACLEEGVCSGGGAGLGVCLLPGGCLVGGCAWWRPPGGLLLRAVRILLECILVYQINTLVISRNFKIIIKSHCKIVEYGLSDAAKLSSQ